MGIFKPPKRAWAPRPPAPPTVKVPAPEAAFAFILRNAQGWAIDAWGGREGLRAMLAAGEQPMVYFAVGYRFEAGRKLRETRDPSAVHENICDTPDAKLISFLRTSTKQQDITTLAPHARAIMDCGRQAARALV